MTVDFPLEVQDPLPASSMHQPPEYWQGQFRLVELAQDIFQAMQVFILDIETLGASLIFVCALGLQNMQSGLCVCCHEATRAWPAAMLFGGTCPQ